jgi:hypothetical protein
MTVAKKAQKRREQAIRLLIIERRMFSDNHATNGGKLNAPSNASAHTPPHHG